MDVEKLIKDLGGTSKVSKLFDISTAAVSKWKREKKIPSARLMYLEVKYPKIFKNLKNEQS